MENNPLSLAVALLGSQQKLAAAVGVKQQHVSNWLRSGRVPAERVIALERATDGRVTRYELRPDIYPVETA